MLLECLAEVSFVGFQGYSGRQTPIKNDYIPASSELLKNNPSSLTPLNECVYGASSSRLTGELVAFYLSGEA